MPQYSSMIARQITTSVSICIIVGGEDEASGARNNFGELPNMVPLVNLYKGINSMNTYNIPSELDMVRAKHS